MFTFLLDCFHCLSFWLEFYEILAAVALWSVGFHEIHPILDAGYSGNSFNKSEACFNLGG